MRILGYVPGELQSSSYSGTPLQPDFLLHYPHAHQSLRHGHLSRCGNVAFWHFDPKQPLWRRLLKVFVSLATTALAYRYCGRLGVFVWFIIILLPLIYVHAIWLPLHGVNGWTGEPREKYHALRGWPPPNR